MENLKPYQRLIKLLQVDKKDIYNIYIYSFFIGITNLTLPLGIQTIINLIQLGTVSASWIVLVFLVILGIVVSGILQYIQLRITENLQQKIFVRSSFEFASRIPRFQTYTKNGEYIPELINRFFDTMTLQKGVPKLLIDFSAAILQLVFGLILLSFYHSFFILFSLILLAVLLAVLFFTGKKGVKTAITESKYKYKVAFWLEELARTMHTFKLNGQSNLPLSRTNELTESYINTRESHFKVLLRQFIQLTTFKLLIAFFLLLIGGFLVINNQMNIGQFVAAEIIILLVINSVEKIISGLETLYDVFAAVDKIGHVMDLPLEKTGETSKDIKENNPLSISVKNINFTFINSGKNVFSDISFEIKPREHTVIFGSDNSGKTTLLKIIGMLYPFNKGSLAYNGIPSTELDIENLRSIIGDYVREQQLFQGTVEENIIMGRDGISFQDMLWASEQTKLIEDVKALSDGFSTQILPDNSNFSRSLIQKIILTRCIINKPKLLLVDDQQKFTSNSLKNSNYLIELLVNENTPWTLITATKNEMWLPYFKQIIILEEGEILFCGTYESYIENFKKK
jgi:ABC-type bacteriocin/lantibiotic exporter with double-glycine peptidase domain